MVKIITNISEVKIKPKLRKGSGAYKDMYFIESRPDLVVKVFDRLENESIYDVKDEEELGKEYPNLFARIYKVNYDKGYMIQEKLNTEDFLKDMNAVFDELNKSGLNKDLDLVAYYYYIIKNKNEDGIKSLFDNLVNKNNISNLKKLTSYFKKLSNVQTSRRLDVHSFNFGYDKNGNIKMLDI